MLYERATGKITDMTPTFDRWVDSVAWSPDSKSIYFTAGNQGENPIYVLNVGQPNPWPQELVDGYNDSPTPTPDGKTAGLRSDVDCRTQRNLHRAASVHASAAWSEVRDLSIRTTFPDCLLSKAKPLTMLNDPVLSQIAMQPMESFWFNGANKEKVQGFIIRPPDSTPRRPIR